MNYTTEHQLTFKDWIAFFGMVFGMFMALLDIQIVSSSIKEIQAGLSATQEEISWIQTSYLIAEVIIIPISGWLSMTFSTRYLFTISCVGFTIMSLLCACSWNLGSMIFFRAMQGLLGGSMIPTLFATIFILFPPKMQQTMTIIVGLVVTMAPISGPILGGYITNYLTWHYLFLINIIPGIVVSLTSWLYINFDQPNFKLLKNIDLIGILLLACMLGTLEYVLEEGPKQEWFQDSLISCLCLLVLVSFVCVIYRQLTIEHPVINLRAFANRNFAIGCTYSFILGWGLFTSVFVMPLFLASIKGLNSLQIGEYLMVTGIFQFCSAPLAGKLSKILDLRIVLLIGLCLFALGNYYNSKMTYESGFWEFFTPQALRGGALLLCFLPINSLALGTLAKDKVKASSSLYNLMRNLGGAIGLAVTSTCIYDWTKLYYAGFRNEISAISSKAEDTIQMLSSNFSSFNYVEPHTSGLAMISGLAQRESYIIAFNQVFISISILFTLSIFLIPFIKNVKITNQQNEVH